MILRFHHFILLCFFSGIVSQGFSQLVFEKQQHDFQELYAASERFVDIRITNKGTKKEFLLSVRKPMEVSYLISGEMVSPDSTIIVRLKPNPRKLGKFRYEAEIYTSDKQAPTVISLTGNTKEFEENATSAMQACPDFSTRPSRSATDFKLTVVTIDKESRQPLAQSSVSLLQNGQPLGSWKTDKNGQIVERTPLGYTYFYGTHIGYQPAELGTYINFQRNYVVLELEKIPGSETPPIEEIPVYISDTVTIYVVADTPEVPLEVLLAEDPVTPSDAPVPTAFSDIPENNFDPQYFKPLNVVFVLDVSSSMLAGDKLELMKYALFQLTDYLRPQDKMGIVTYATQTRILLPPTSGDQKDKIRTPVQRLKASGTTSGAEGIKLGLEQAMGAFIKDGANQVIIITDGAFNKNSVNYLSQIQKYREQGIVLSVVGIQNLPKDEVKMKEAAALGGGRYVPILKLSDAQMNLIREIRLTSFRN